MPWRLNEPLIVTSDDATSSSSLITNPLTSLKPTDLPHELHFQSDSSSRESVGVTVPWHWQSMELKWLPSSVGLEHLLQAHEKYFDSCKNNKKFLRPFIHLYLTIWLKHCQNVRSSARTSYHSRLLFPYFCWLIQTKPWCSGYEMHVQEAVDSNPSAAHQPDHI